GFGKLFNLSRPKYIFLTFSCTFNKRFKILVCDYRNAFLKIVVGTDGTETVDLAIVRVFAMKKLRKKDTILCFNGVFNETLNLIYPLFDKPVYDRIEQCFGCHVQI